jgi:hypothetical protein
VLPSGVRPNKRSAATSAMTRDWPNFTSGAGCPAGV